MSSAKREKFTSSFPVWMSFLSFSCQIALTRTSNIVLNRNGENDLPCLVPDLTRKAFSFSPLWCSSWACHIMSFNMLRYIPSIPNFLRIFFIKECWICQILFLYLLQWSWFLFFILLIWFITSIDLYLLNHPCISGINPIWSWYIIF